MSESDEPMFLLLSSFRPSNNLVYVVVDRDADLVALVDDRTGARVGPPVGAGADSFPTYVDATADGSLVAMSFDVVERDVAGRTFVVDGESGEVVFEVESPVPATVIEFDEANGQLLAGMLDGTIWIIDISSGEVIEQVETTTTSRFKDLSVRADGVVIAVSDSQIEHVDRSGDPTDPVVELRSPRWAWIRADGTVLVLTAEFQFETIDPRSNTLIEQKWEVDPAAHTAFNAGLAGSMDPEVKVPEVVDLTTGARTTYGLITREGDQFPAVKVYPEPDGIWAFSDTNVMARWEGEVMVEEVPLGGAHLNRTQSGDLIAVMSERPDGTWVVHLVSTERGQTRELFKRDAVDAVEVHPSVDGGVHIIDVDGRLITYDSTGEVTSEIETGLEGVGHIAVDPATGKVALVANPELVIVDPSTGTVSDVADIGIVSTMGFGRDGELLVLTGFDGTVRLWDVEREEVAGLVWNGSGQASSSSPSWYDENTESMWVTSSGFYLQIPLNPERWIERACEIVSRDLTQDEWDRFVPGDEPLRSACV